MKRRKFNGVSLLWISAVLFFFPTGVAIGQNAALTSAKAEEQVPQSELDKLKTEWEAVREQQVQMILEKEKQLEKLKEEIFSRMRTPSEPAVSPASSEHEAQREALRAERQKFFAEMSRQKENLRQLQSALDEKAKRLEAERDRFEQEKKTAAR